MATAPVIAPVVVPAADPCSHSMRTAIEAALLKAANAGGKALYDMFVSTWNSFISLVEAAAEAMFNILTALIEIDEFVYRTFIQPPLNAVISIADLVQRTIRTPAAVAGATSNACPSTTSIGKAIGRIASYQAQDFDKLKNNVDSINYFFEQQQVFLDALDKLPGYMDRVKIDKTYEEFIAASGKLLKKIS